ncbi:Subunit of heteropentameric Replication factor C (RF-C) [Malassezia sympodialis ATCC 42132]|uniref:Replication factor C subunit 2 n=1 Tax=Malassezia sympodialis (strain ATCC 42132) TaxID=1230383 RepID=A0A1M8A7S1_MALS4|nr:Subunit of heteropentameric Replication factor C (RF-C) [Malassezia sympodialis ATCC 42132]
MASEGRPWVERYRPKSIDDVASQQHAVDVLRKALSSTNLPHMLFYGPPGTGKTSTILALARQLFGPELMRSRVLELNASDERGISVVREKIKSFAMAAVSAPDPRFPSPPYKIVILDEADSMTQDAQGALRRIMEQHSRITRFCLICNYITRIIEPLASRCSKFRFRPLDIASTEARLAHIAEAEGLQLSPEIIPALIRASDGDMRRSITYLQSVARLATARGGDVRSMSAATVSELAGVVPTDVIESLAQSIGINSDESMSTAAGSDFDRISRVVDCIVREGYSCMQVVLQLHDYIITHPLLNARQKAQCALQLGSTDKALMDGGLESLQLLSLSLALHQAVRSP